VAEFDPVIRRYYERGGELDRLGGGFPSGPLELERTKELISRYLPDGPLHVLDVGGGPGVYAEWLARAGHRVRLIDPIELHLGQAVARHPGISVARGDARHLDVADATFDVVLLLGPLYHLTERVDRIRALGEARRALRTDGILFAAGISRFAALHDLLVRLDRLHEDDVLSSVKDAVSTGVLRGREGGLFTTAYFHLPGELRDEVNEASFNDIILYNVEGPGYMVKDFETRWPDPDRREALLAAARLVETEPSTMGSASHLLVIAHR
jgi:SAM-dependent methyltransferase